MASVLICFAIMSAWDASQSLSLLWDRFPVVVALVLLLLAAVELAEPRRRSDRSLPALILLALSFVIIMTCGYALVAYIGLRAGNSAKEIIVHILNMSMVILQNFVVASVLLAAALRLRAREGYGPGRRLMPVLDRWSLRKQVGYRPTPCRAYPIAREMLLYLVLILATSVLWLLFARHFFGARTSPDLVKSINTPLLKAVALVLIVQAPFYEEMLFRGFLMEWLLRLCKRVTGQSHSILSAFVAIFVSSAVWALCHQGQLEPAYVKWLQIFAIGLVLGVARLRLGLEACVLLHLLFNVGQIVLSVLEKLIHQMIG